MGLLMDIPDLLLVFMQVTTTGVKLFWMFSLLLLRYMESHPVSGVTMVWKIFYWLHGWSFTMVGSEVHIFGAGVIVFHLFLIKIN